MNLKVIKYLCGCSYIWILDPDKTVLPRHSECPEHKRKQKNVTLWCADCDKKVIAVPRAGYRQNVCYDCKLERQRTASREWYAAHPDYYRGRNTNKYRKAKPQETRQETPRERESREFKEWAAECDNVLPAVLSPLLDKFISESS